MSSPLSKNLSWELANPLWASALNPIISSPQSSALILTNIKLQAGINIINHTLGRNMQGWSVVDINAPITLFRSAPMNSQTLTLTANGPAVVNLEVF